MPYYDFIDREDVYEIIKETLEYYFDTKLRIYDEYTLPQTQNEEMFICFPRINSIMHERMSDDLKDYIKRDNRITYNYLRRIIMNIYLFGVFKYPKMLTDRSIIIENAPKNSKDLLIYPGNKKIKIINFKEKIIDNVLKKGFDDQWFSKEIEIREKPRWDFILPLTKIKEGIYRENLIIGFPYPRLQQKTQKELLIRIENYIEEFQFSVREEKISNYKIQLVDNIKVGLSTICNKIQQTKLNDLMNFVSTLLRLIRNHSTSIKLTFSHGDLQSGNLFYQNDNDKLWILDWETWGIRSEYYDKMLFFYNLRNSNNLVENLKLMFNDRGNKMSMSSYSLFLLRDLTIIFILEDILWQLEETKVLPNGALSNGIKNYITLSKQKELLKLLSSVR